MRFIDKPKRCQEFDNFISNPNNLLGKWDLPTDVKTTLHNHLVEEQKGLCIYCQQAISKKSGIDYPPKTLIEHLRPRGKYPELTFVYCNLSVSCQGFDCHQKVDRPPKGKKFCGHGRGEEYDENKFLNPTELTDLEEYFEYSADGKIRPSKKAPEKAEYMIEILDLKHETLKDMRKEQHLIFKERLDSGLLTIEELEELLSDSNSSELPPFYSMLKFLFAM